MSKDSSVECKKCKCDYSVTEATHEIEERRYHNGILIYERARCPICGELAWELSRKVRDSIPFR